MKQGARRSSDADARGKGKRARRAMSGVGSPVPAVRLIGAAVSKTGACDATVLRTERPAARIGADITLSSCAR